MFPSIRSSTRAMLENTVSSALRRTGLSGEKTHHSFSGMASTRLNESQIFPIDAKSYTRPQRKEQRESRVQQSALFTRTNQDPADYLDGLKAGGIAFQPEQI